MEEWAHLSQSGGGLDGQKIWAKLLVGREIFLFTPESRTSLGLAQALFMGTDGPFFGSSGRGVKTPLISIYCPAAELCLRYPIYTYIQVSQK
jgi:hypothetical protein